MNASIPEIPDENSTPIEIRTFYEAHQRSFESLQQSFSENEDAVE